MVNSGPTEQYPRVIDRYELIEALGKGGFGTVFRARHIHTNQVVALKVMRASSEAQSPKHLVREAQIAAGVKHPNVVQVFDAGIVGDVAFVAMELVQGNSLARMLAHSGPMPLHVAMPLAEQLLAGLGAAHAAGVIHRDIKPQNLIVLADGMLKVLDFGISKATFIQQTQASQNNWSGTPGFMAPEQFQNAGIDARVDVYSAGATLFAMFCVRAPFMEESFPVLLNRILTERAPSLAQFRPDLPRAVIDAVDRALARDRDARFPNVAEFARALRGHAAPTDAATVSASLPPGAAAAPMGGGPMRGGPMGGALQGVSHAHQATPHAGAHTPPGQTMPSKGGKVAALAIVSLIVFGASGGALAWHFAGTSDDVEGVDASASPAATTVEGVPSASTPTAETSIPQASAGVTRAPLASVARTSSTTVAPSSGGSLVRVPDGGPAVVSGGKRVGEACQSTAECAGKKARCEKHVCTCTGAGARACNGICVAIDNDGCESCGQPCADDKRCILRGFSGEAVCRVCDGSGAQASCAPHQCSDLNSDRNNCGACGKSCGANGQCRRGTCFTVSKIHERCATSDNCAADLDMTLECRASTCQCRWGFTESAGVCVKK